MSRTTLIALCAALALVLTAASGGVASTIPSGVHAKARVTCHVKRVHGKRRRVCVPVKKRKQPEPTAEPEAQPGPPGPVGTPVTFTALDGSAVTLDLGAGRIRTLPLSGSYQGYVVGRFQQGAENDVQITRGQLDVAPTDTMMDDCAWPAIVRTNPATRVTVDPTSPSTAHIAPDGSITLKEHVLIRTVLDLRAGQPCGSQPIPSGYADITGTIPLYGQLGGANTLGDFDLVSHPFPLPLLACYIPGDPAKPCSFPATPLLTTATVDMHMALGVGG